MKGALANFIGTFLSKGTGCSNLNGRQCFRVPAGLDTKATVSLVSEGWDIRPEEIPALSEAAERGIVLPMIATLNCAMAAELSESVSFERTGKAILKAKREMGKRQLVAIVGGSHAGHLADEPERHRYSLSPPLAGGSVKPMWRQW